MCGCDVFLGIDVGTTSVKAALIDVCGTMVAQHGCEYPLFQPKPNWAEQSALDWWDTTVRVVGNLCKKSEIRPERIKGISVSCQAPTCLGVDENGVPVGNALIWMDRRAQEICDRVLSPYADELREVCGNRVDPYYFLPKYLWYRTYRQEEAKRAKKYLQINGWVVYCMTGKMSLDTTHLTHLQVYDVFQDSWSEKLLALFDMDQDLFPEIFSPSDVVGTLTRDAAEQLGLRQGIPVVAGCTDAAATALGLQHIRPGSLFEMSGQSSGIGLVTDRPLQNHYLNLSRGALPSLWNQKGSMSTTGGALRWFRDVVDVDAHGRQQSTYQEYDLLAEQSCPGANGVIFLPYMMGERAPLWDSSACGMLFGLRTTTTKGDIIRAIFEGTAYGLRTIRDTFDRGYLQAGYLSGVGGGYKSTLWAQIKADVLSMEIRVQHVEYDGACMGDAILASMHTGTTVKSTPEKAQIIYKPNATLSALYDERYQLFKELYCHNKGLMAKNFQSLMRWSNVNR